MNQPKNLFQDLDKKKIEYVIWKNCNLIDDFFKGNENLDIYIDQKQKKEFESIIRENLWVEVKSTTINHRNIHHYLSINNEKIYHIHVYFRMFTGNSITKNYDLTGLYDYFENKNFDTKNNLWIMDFKLQLELFKIRMACKRKSFLGRFLIHRDLDNYVKELQLLINNSKYEKNFIFSNIKIDKEKIKFYNKSDPKKILNHIVNYKRFNEFISLLFEIKFLLKVLINKIFKYKKFRFKKKVYIFISGADSSGKTTLINDYEKLFSKYFKTKIYNIGKPFPQFLSTLFIKKKKIPNHNKKEINILKIFKNIILGLFRYVYSLSIFYFHGKTNIFLLDRYVSELPGHINGPRSKQSEDLSRLKQIMFLVESYFYKLIKTINIEFRLITTIDTCLKRNKERLKKTKESDDEIIIRHKLFSKSKFKSQKVIELNNDSNKNKPIYDIIKILVNDLNENN